jgi:hypothetical protein
MSTFFNALFCFLAITCSATAMKGNPTLGEVAEQYHTTVKAIEGKVLFCRQYGVANAPAFVLANGKGVPVSITYETRAARVAACLSAESIPTSLPEHPETAQVVAVASVMGCPAVPVTRGAGERQGDVPRGPIASGL